MASPHPSISLMIESTLALIKQFSKSLSSSNPLLTTETESSPSPLPLLSTAASALKSQVTKLSLLTITTPFTPSAICSALTPLNESILPSLTTATLLITPTNFTSSFANEAAHLSITTLKDLSTLVEFIQARNKDKKPTSDLAEAKKKEITEVTGKIWEDCDDLVRFANGGLSGFVVKKANQWLELMKDAVKELQDYDPEENDDEDGFFDDGREISEPEENDETDPSGTIKAGVKTEALKVITRVPQSMHVVIKQRLGNMPPPTELSPVQRMTIDTILRNSRLVSEYIDECAENMYMGDLEGCLKRAGQARQMTIEIVESVFEPWETQGQSEGRGQGGQPGGTKQDLYIKRALEWVRQVEPGPVVAKQAEKTTLIAT